jgi:hypothetical protein
VSDDRKLLAVALAQAAQGGQLAVGGVTTAGSASGGDFLQSLIDALAYAADVLTVELDEVADEEYIATSYDRGLDILLVDFLVDLRPVVCVVLDPDNVYLVTVGDQTGDSCVRFGDGSHGARPPDGFEKVAATYRHGDGDGGALELVGLGLGEPVWLIAVRRNDRPLFCRVRCRDSGAGL